jgi:hypothetical protein
MGGRAAFLESLKGKQCGLSWIRAVQTAIAGVKDAATATTEPAVRG